METYYISKGPENLSHHSLRPEKGTPITSSIFSQERGHVQIMASPGLAVYRSRFRKHKAGQWSTMRRQLAPLVQRLSALSWHQAGSAPCTCSFSASALVAQAPQSAVCEVPAGHENSDLRNSICNISLNRRRDISLRSDIKLWKQDDECMDLRQLLRGKEIAEVLDSS